MNFIMEFYIPPTRLTFDLAAQLETFADHLGAKLNFKHHTGTLTFTVSPPYHFEVITKMKECEAIPTAVRGEDVKSSFRAFFGTDVPIDFVKMEIYCTLCEEGRIK